MRSNTRAIHCLCLATAITASACTGSVGDPASSDGDTGGSTGSSVSSHSTGASDGGAGGSGSGTGASGGSGGSGSTGSGGQNHTTPPILGSCEADSTGDVFEVGDGQSLSSLDEVPWSTLGPGDTVRVHWRAQPFRSKVLLSTRGADGHPIKVCGVPGPNGELPVVDGNGATTSANQHWIDWTELQDYGVLVIASDRDAAYDDRPGFIEVANLELRGAVPGATYTTNTGAQRSFTDRGTGLYVVNGDHLTFRGNVITDNSYGLFVLSKSEQEATLSREILIEGNSIFGNGVAGSDHRHNSYTQALGVTIQFNHFGPLRDGAIGVNLKDRSAGTIIRYNWVEDGARILDLVDAQEHAADAVADPRYHDTYVYGNVLIAGPGAASQVVHYGGDSVGDEQNFRKGTLHFFYNTVITNHPVEEVWETTAVNLETDDEGMSAFGNVFWNQGTSTLRIVRHAGHATLGTNWVSQGFKAHADEFSGNVTGLENQVVGTAPNLDPATFAPLAGSPVIDAGPALGGGESNYPVEFEFLPPSSMVARAMSGAALDLGAYEAQ